MFSNPTQWLLAAFIGVPLALTGCGGGGSGGSSATPTATPTATPAVNTINLRFSAATGVSAPATVTYSDGTAQTYIQLQSGNAVLSANYHLENGAYRVILNVSKAGNFQSGDSFALANGNANSQAFTYNDSADSYAARSGTFKINALTVNPATGGNRPTTTVSFSLSNVVLRSLKSPNTGFTLNGSGQFIAQNAGF